MRHDEEHPPIWSDDDEQTFPSKMWCWEHGMYRNVLREGKVASANFDPTQTYVLDCGHVVI